MKYLSALLTQSSGSLGGATFAKNRGGNYIRKRIAPVQPRTVAQQNVRSNLATIAASWKTLTPDQVAGWNSLASTVTLKDSLGNSYNPSGIDLYVANNRNLSDIGEAIISDPPSTAVSFEDISPLTVTVAAGTAAFTIAPTIDAAPTGTKFLVRATPQLSSGVSYIGRSKYRNVESFAATAYASLNVLAAYNALFGTLVAGQNIGVQVSMTDIATGFKSLAVTALATVAS
jgi:hypothetical protein